MTTWFLTKMTDWLMRFHIIFPADLVTLVATVLWRDVLHTYWQKWKQPVFFSLRATRKTKPFHFRRNEMSPAEYRELLNSSCFFASESHTLEWECNRLALDQAGLLTCQSKGQIRDMHSLALQSATKHWCRIAWRSPMISHQKASASHRLHLSLTGLPWFDFFWLCSNRVWARHTKPPF